MLDWGGQRPGWYEEVYPKIRKNPPFLLFSGDFRLIEVADLEKELLRTEQRLGNIFKLIPFGRDGAGDFYVFKFHPNGNLESICILNWDESLVTLAKDFEDFVFRALLGAVVQINPEDIENDDEYNKDLFAMLESHKPYITQGRYEKLKSIYSKEITENDGEFGKISIDEYYKMLIQEINFPDLHKKIDLTEIRKK